MEIVPLCPFEAGAFLWEAAPGQQSLTVLVKATFTLAPGELEIARTQDRLSEERHLEDSALASLHWPGDFAPLKRKVDITLVGHAYAPGGRPTEALTARLTVGEFSKAVHVVGDRGWTRGPDGQPVPSPPAPFTRLPVRYERAPLSSDNPVGLDAGPAGALASSRLPNLERGGGAGMPCFGPISPQWRSRRRLLDDAAMFWAYGVARAPNAGAPPIGPAPPRFDFAFFNAAPADQQIDLLRAGAPLVLDNLNPVHARLEARLPAIRPQVFRVPPAELPRARIEEIILRADTLWIDTDRSVVVITWRGIFDAGPRISEVGTLVIDADPQGKKLRWDRVERRYAEVRPPTLRLPAEGAPSSSRRAVVTGPDPLSIRYDGVSRVRPPDGPPPARKRTLTEAISPAGLGPDAIPDEPTSPLADEARPGRVPPRAPEAPRRTSPPKPASAPPVATRASSKPLLVLGSAGAKPVLGKPPPPVEGAGKLAQKPSASPLTAPPSGPPRAGKTAPLSAPAPALRKDIDLGRYATICAELARKGADRSAVLKAHLLTEPAWSLVDQHYKKALAEETEQGERALLLAFDEAYLAGQERYGKAIGVEEYARLQVGIERGEVGRVLGELSLELGDLMRLQRVWTKRLGESRELGERLARALEETRWTMV